MNKNNIISLIIFGFLLVSLASSGVLASEDVTIYESNGDLVCEAQDMSVFAATGWRWFKKDSGVWVEVKEDKTRDISNPYPISDYSPDETATYRCDVYASDDNWNNYDAIGSNQIFYESPYDVDPINGLCGSEDGKVYNYDETSWETNDFCEVGSVSPSNPSFPSTDSSTSWTCLGEDGGDDASCSASREEAPQGTLSGDVNNLELSCDSTYSLWATTGWRWFKKDGNDWMEISTEKERKTSTSITVDEPGDYKCAIYFSDQYWNNYDEGDSLVLTAVQEPKEPIRINSINVIGDLKVGNEVKFTSDVINYDSESIEYSWYVDNEVVSSSDSFNYVFDESGNYDITLKVSDDFSSDQKTISVSVDISELNVDVSYYEYVVSGHDQVLSFHVTDDEGDVTSADVEISGDRSGSCTTGSSGGCNIHISESEEDEISLNYVVSKDDYDSVSGNINYEVIPERYEIKELNTFSNSDYSVIEDEFFRGDSLYLSFLVWDIVEEKYIIPDVSEAYLVGDGDRKELDFDGTDNDSLRFNTDVPLTDHFLGKSFNVVFAFDFDYSYGGQKEIEVLLKNNPPFVISELNDFSMNFGSTKTINLDNYFRDREDNALGYDLNYSYEGCSNQDVSIDGSNLVLEANSIDSCNLDVTATDRNGASVSSNFELTVIEDSFDLDVNYFPKVILGNNQTLTFSASKNGEALSGVEINLYGLDDVKSCTTGASGGCNIKYTSDEEGSYDLTYDASVSGYETIFGNINYEVIPERYEIRELNTFSNSDYSVIEDEFFRGDSLYLSFLVWDIVEEKYIIPDVSEAYLVGDGDRKELDFDGTDNDSLRFNTDVPLTDHFLGKSFNVVFAFDFDYSYGGQKEIEVLLKNNPPFVISELNDFSMNFGSTKTINLDNYFRDREDNALGYDLNYSYEGCSNQDVSIDGSNLVLEANSIDSCNLDVTATDRNGASVSSNFELTVIEDSFDLDVNYFPKVILGNNQTLTFSASKNGEALSGVEINLYGLDDVKSCTTGASGGCNIKYTPDEEGSYDLTYDASVSGHENISGDINYEVIPKRYEIFDLNSFNDSNYALEDKRFALGESLYVSFRVWDILEEDYTMPEVSEAFLVGDGVRKELEFDETHDGFIRFNTEIPYDDKYLGESFSVVFAFDHDYKYGGQREIPLYIYKDASVQKLEIISPIDGEIINEKDFELKYYLESNSRIPKLDLDIYGENKLVETKTFSGVNGYGSKKIELSKEIIESYQNLTINLSLRDYDEIYDTKTLIISDELQRKIAEGISNELRITKARTVVSRDNVCVSLASHISLNSRTEIVFSIRDLGLRYRKVVRDNDLGTVCFNFPSYDSTDLRGELLRIEVRNDGNDEVHYRVI
ncbi:MAG: PKD domain-containing protein [Halanaerobiales bacterium]